MGRVDRRRARRFSRRTSTAIRRYPVTPLPRRHARARSARCRAPTTTPAPKTIYAAFNYPGRRRARRRDRDRDAAAVERLVDIKGPTIYTVTSLAWDPDDRHALLHDRQRRATATSCGSIRRRAGPQSLQKDARIGDLAFNRADKSLWGIRHLNGIVHAGAHPAALHGVDAGRDAAVRHRRVRPRRLADGTRWSASFGEISGEQDVRVLRRRGAAQRATSTPVARVRLRHGGAERLRLLARRPVSVRQLVLHRRLEHLPLRARDRGSSRRSPTPRPGSSGRFRSADDELHRVPVHRRRVRAGAHRAAAARGRQRRSRSSASGWRRSTRS